MNLEKIGYFIVLLRKERGLTQIQLAEKIGVSDKTISKWERGICLPGLSSINALLLFFNISLMEFYAGEKNHKTPSRGVNKLAQKLFKVCKNGETKKAIKLLILFLYFYY